MSIYDARFRPESETCCAAFLGSIIQTPQVGQPDVPAAFGQGQHDKQNHSEFRVSEVAPPSLPLSPPLSLSPSLHTHRPFFVDDCCGKSGSTETFRLLDLFRRIFGQPFESRSVFFFSNRHETVCHALRLKCRPNLKKQAVFIFVIVRGGRRNQIFETATATSATLAR